jgi:hypothetical protein
MGNNVIPKPQKYLKNGWFRSDLLWLFTAEGMFYVRSCGKFPGLDENYLLAADFELWTRFQAHTEPVSFTFSLF